MLKQIFIKLFSIVGRWLLKLAFATCGRLSNLFISILPLPSHHHTRVLLHQKNPASMTTTTTMCKQQSVCLRLVRWYRTTSKVKHIIFSCIPEHDLCAAHEMKLLSSVGTDLLPTAVATQCSRTDADCGFAGSDSFADAVGGRRECEWILFDAICQVQDACQSQSWQEFKQIWTWLVLFGGGHMVLITSHLQTKGLPP